MARLRGALVMVLALALAVATGGVGTASGTVLFGANPGSGDRLDALLDLEASIDRKLDLVRVFEVWDSEFPTAYHDEIVDGGRTMLLSVRAKRLDGTFIPWRSIADAEPGTPLYDQLVGWIDRIAAVDAPVWFTFNHEPEIAENLPNGTAADFIDAWRRVVDEFRDRSVDNVEFVWIMTDYSFDLPPSDRRHAGFWYPGDDVVDMIAADAYNWSDCRPGEFNPWRPLEDIIDPLRDFGAEHPGQRLLLAEWASTESGGDKAEWISEAASLFTQPGWEQFVAISYFNQMDSAKPACNWPVDSSVEALAAFAAMGADPFYGGSAEPNPVVFAAKVDAAGVTAPRWISTTYTAMAAGPHTLTLDWVGNAMLRFDLRVATTGAWVGADTSDAHPKTITATLTAGQTYRIATWAMTGAADFTVTAGAPGGDVPPTVTITSPAGGAVVSGAGVAVTATAGDDLGVSSVEFRAGDSVLGVDTNGADGWATSFDTTGFADGDIVVTAMATDTGGQTASDAVTVTIDNGVPAPIVIFTHSIDATSATAPRWTSTTFTPASSGTHVFTLDWTGTAMLRFDLRVAATGAWVGADVGTAQPKTITSSLTAGTGYRVAVWAMSGAADFTVTVVPPL